MTKLIAVASVGELAPDQMKRLNIVGKKILLAYANEQYYAVDEMCSHEDYSLYLGCVQDGKIKCSLHGSYFDLKTGTPLCEPADEVIKTYPVKIKQNQIYIEV